MMFIGLTSSSVVCMEVLNGVLFIHLPASKQPLNYLGHLQEQFDPSRNCAQNKTIETEPAESSSQGQIRDIN